MAAVRRNNFILVANYFKIGLVLILNNKNMLYHHLVQGGIWFMLPIYILGIAVVVLTGILTYTTATKRLDDPDRLKKLREIILFLGTFALLFGIFGQIVGMMQIMDIVEREGDIPSFLIMGGLRISMLPLSYSFFIFLISLLSWFIFRMASRRIS